MTRFALLALLGGAIALSDGTAQDTKKADPDLSRPKSQRAHYVVKNGDPNLLAQVVGRHFHGEATVLSAPEGSGNAILVSGTPAAVPEILKLLEQLDRRPRTIEVEVIITDVAKESEIKPEELKGGQRIRLTAVEGRPITSTTGGNKPVVTGGGPKGGGPKGGGPWGGNSVNYVNTGTTLKMIARAGTDDAIAVELDLTDSSLRPAPAGDEAGAPALESATLTTHLSVP